MALGKSGDTNRCLSHRGLAVQSALSSNHDISAAHGVLKASLA